MARRKTSKTKNIIASIICLVLGLALGFVFETYRSLPDSYKIPEKVAGGKYESVVTGEIDSEVVLSNDLSIHFIELGNKYTGDCTFIKVGDTEMLIDAGSRASSIPYIAEYIDTYCTDGVLEYVVVTHAHQDHYAGFATNSSTDSLFDLYKVETIIEFAQTYKSESASQYKNYRREVEEELTDNNGALFTALDCIEGTATMNGQTASRTFDLSDDGSIYFEILDQKFYHPENKDEADSENNFSVCLQIVQGDKKYLFTGGLEEEGAESLVALNGDSLSHVELYKAGHHGSKTSSSNALLEVITPNVVCVCCCAGSSEYTSKNENQFPTQEFIDRVSPYTNQIYVTTLCVDYKANKFESFNGNIVVCASTNQETKETTIAVFCSNNTTVLKDTEWFKANRTLPENAVA